MTVSLWNSDQNDSIAVKHWNIIYFYFFLNLLFLFSGTWVRVKKFLYNTERFFLLVSVVLQHSSAINNHAIMFFFSFWVRESLIWNQLINWLCSQTKNTLNIYETFTWFYSERAIYSFIAGRPHTAFSPKEKLRIKRLLTLYALSRLLD